MKMAISAKQVSELRRKTGAGMMDCKKALVECDGDVAKAEEFLQKGLAAVGKRSGRVAAESCRQLRTHGPHRRHRRDQRD